MFNKIKKISNSNIGFTMIELLVYLSLLIVVVMATSSFMVDTVRSAARAMDEKEVSQSSRLVIARLTQEIKTAGEITSVTADRIDLKNAVNVPVFFYWDSVEQALYFNDGLTGEQLNNGGVSVANMDFNQDADNIVNIRMTMKKKNAAASVGGSYALETEAWAVPRQELY